MNLSDFNRNDKVILIDGATGTVFSKGTTKIVVLTEDGRTVMATPDQVSKITR